MNGSGLSEIILESGICASGSLNRVMNGKHFNRALRVHKLVFEALQRLLLIRFVEMNPQFELLSQETHNMMMDLIDDPCKENVSKIKDSEEFKAYFQRYRTFTSELLDGNHGKTAQFWMRHMDIVQKILTLIRATKENNLQLHIAALYALCPMFFAYDHCNYARYVPVYLITLMYLSKTHPGCKELLETEWIQCVKVKSDMFKKCC